MRILVIGNMFESKSFLVDNFCEKDCEVAAENVTSRISGAAIVVSTIAVFFNLEPYLFSTAKESCVLVWIRSIVSVTASICRGVPETLVYLVKRSPA